MATRTKQQHGIGRKLAAARRNAGMTQAHLAAAAGLDRTALSKIEAGRRAVEARELATFAGVLGRPVTWFLDEDPPPTLGRLRRMRRRILEVTDRHGASNVRVFGSVVQGRSDEHSDIDLLVDMEGSYSLFDIAALVVDLQVLLGRDVDVATPTELKDDMRERVLREAVPL